VGGGVGWIMLRDTVYNSVCNVSNYIANNKPEIIEEFGKGGYYFLQTSAVGVTLVFTFIVARGSGKYATELYNYLNRN